MQKNDPFASADLYYHFGDSVLTSQDALFGWLEHLLFMFDSPLSENQLCEHLSRGKFLDFGISVESQEIHEIVIKAVQNGSFIKTHETLTLSPERRYALEQSQLDVERLYQDVKASWADEIRTDHPEVTTDLVDELWNGLSKFTAVILRRYARRSAVLANGTTNDLTVQVFDKDHPLFELAQAEYPKFFLSDDPEKQSVIAKRMTNVLYALSTRQF